MRWSKLKSTIESFFVEKAKGRVQLHTTGYRRPGNWDDEGRSWLTLDGSEIVNFPHALDYLEWAPEPENRQRLENESRLGPRRLRRAMESYLDLSIDEILQSDDSLVRCLGMLDRRMGKRRLRKLDLTEEPPLVRFLYLFRCSIESVPPSCEDNREELLTHLTKSMKRQRLDQYGDLAARASREAKAILSSPSKHNLSTLLPRLFRGEVETAELHTDVARELHRAFEGSEDRDTLLRVLSYVESCSKLLESSDYARGVTALAIDSGRWRRPLEAWTPRTHNQSRQFSSLARHLWADYDVPLFMDQAWTSGTGRDQEWFRHIGGGNNLRTAAELPISVTKRVAHHFMNAPPTYAINEALRWAQIHAMGGDRRLADAVRESRLVREFDDEEFWSTVLRFFVENPMLDTVHVNPIVDYIHNQRFVPRLEFIDRGVAEERPPAQPGFSMHGRTAESLLRAVDRWHEALGRERKGGDLRWTKSAIDDFSFVEGSAEHGTQRRWTIRELLSSRELIDEGRQMQHCVATYARSCHSKACSVWTMEVLAEEATEKKVTIELRHPELEIRQVRGRLNRRATVEELSILRRWASLHDIKIASYLEHA